MMPTPPAIIQTVHAVDLDALLEAISAVESRGRDDAVGANGERGRYQMKRETWQELTHESFDKAYDPVYATPVARQRMFRLKWELAERHVAVTPETLALMWKCGANAAILAKWTDRRDRNYAIRVANLYKDR